MTMKTNASKDDHLESALKAGLSAKAAAVYVALLRSGDAMVPKAVVLATGIHRQYVYDGLRELKDRRLVANLGAGRRIKYLAASPDVLFQDAERERLRVLDGATALMRLYDTSPAGTVEVIRGSRAVIESEFEMLQLADRDSFLDIVGGAGMRWVYLFQDRIEEWEVLRKEKNISLRYIGTEQDVRHNRETSVIHNESRVIPGIGDMVNVAIRPDSVSFNIYEPEILTVRVRNLAAVESQRALFEVLWKVAK